MPTGAMKSSIPPGGSIPRTPKAAARSATPSWALSLTAAIGPLIVYKFTVNKSLALLDAFPEERASELFLGEGNGTLFSRLASWMEARIDAAAAAGADVFDGIVTGVRTVLDALTLALNGSPWPVVMLVICVTAWRAAGPRVAIFTAAAMAYTALLGYWEVRWKPWRWWARR